MTKTTLDKPTIITAIKKWCLGADGFEGAIGGITFDLPCPFAYPAEAIWCAKYNDEIDKAIGGRFALDEQIYDMLTNEETRKAVIGRLDNFAEQVFMRIEKVHKSFIAKFEEKALANLPPETMLKTLADRFAAYDKANDHLLDLKNEEIETLCDHPNRDMWDEDFQKEYNELLDSIRDAEIAKDNAFCRVRECIRVIYGDENWGAC